MVPPGSGASSANPPYTPSMSRTEVQQFTDAEPATTEAAARWGLTMSDVYHLVHERPLHSLSPDEARVVLDIRESIPMPTSGDIMQKILGSTDVRALIDRSYYKPAIGGPQDTVGGFVARAADAQKLIDSHQIADGFGLDYDTNRTVPAKFTEPSGGTYAVRFRMTDEFDLRVPAGEAAEQAGLPLDRSGRPYFSPPDMDPLGPENPYLGTGFVGKGATEIIPEYHLPTRTELKDGTEIYRITPDGREILVAYKEAGDWVEL